MDGNNTTGGWPTLRRSQPSSAIASVVARCILSKTTTVTFEEMGRSIRETPRTVIVVVVLLYTNTFGKLLI